MVQNSSNSLVHVVDSFFPDHILGDVQKWAMKLPTKDTWYEFENMLYGHNLFMAARNYFDLELAIGCEMHINHDTPTKHYDKDELLWQREQKLSFPLCSIVYYPLIQMDGGHLIFPEVEVAVAPKTNRAVFFREDLLHDGIPFTGIRQSIGINPWAELPLAYR